jgi:NAD(P)-dependent dehydrogenase (short-subunit alcohol dehydrogenase family)
LTGIAPCYVLVFITLNTQPVTRNNYNYPMQITTKKKPLRKPQHQQRPGIEKRMEPVPVTDDGTITGSGKLKNKVALITGGDSGIGKAVALLFAKEGADIAIVYLDEDTDAGDVKKTVEEKYGRSCLLVSADISKENACKRAVQKTIKQFGRIDVLVNNAGIHYESKSLTGISSQQLMKTFATNVFAMFWITQAVLPHMKKGSTIVNTTSVTAYRGSAQLIDYASTKGAIVSFTRSLATSLIEKGIRVNAVAPGPVWTPLIASSFKPEKVAQHGSDAPMKRSGEPVEIAPCYLFLASRDSSYISGQVLHPNGGEIVNG